MFICLNKGVIHKAVNRYGKHSAVYLIASLFMLPTLALSSDACDIIDDTLTVIDIKKRSIPLLEFKPLYLRAASGKIRCEYDEKNNRQVCNADGRAELYIEGAERPPQVIHFKSDKVGEAHIYASGDLTCGWQSDFN